MSDETTLYRLYGPEETLLYVGISDHPWRRFQQHAATQPWWGDVRGLSLDRFPDRSQALEAERQAIKTECPLHNECHNEVRRQLVAAASLTRWGNPRDKTLLRAKRSWMMLQAVTWLHEQKVVAAYEKHQSYEAVAEHVGRNPEGVRQVLRRRGVQLRGRGRPRKDG